MPRYFFHIQGPEGPIWDNEGSELADLNAVRDEALTSARELMSDQVKMGSAPDGHEFFITDETKNVLMRVPFKESFDKK